MNLRGHLCRSTQEISPSDESCTYPGGHVHPGLQPATGLHSPSSVVGQVSGQDGAQGEYTAPPLHSRKIHL